MPKSKPTPLEEIENLFKNIIYGLPNWQQDRDYYISTKIPNLMKNHSTNEKLCVDFRGLRQILTDSEWEQLPKWIELRWRKVKLPEFEMERVFRQQEESRRLEELKEKESKRLEELKEKEEENQLINNLQKKFQDDFLSADLYFENYCSKIILQGSKIRLKVIYDREKISFIRLWISKNIPEMKIRLHDEQYAAIGAVNGNVQVVARAGSGKTMVVVYRAFFLLKHCRVQPCEMLLLAFNRKAVDEIINRLKTFSLVELPFVMNFDQFTLALAPEKKPLKEKENFIQNIIDNLRKDPTFETRVRETMLAFCKEDLEINSDLSPEDRLKYNRSMKLITLNGDDVQSKGEKSIANFLFEHDILYKHEYKLKVLNFIYRPDFYLKGRKTIIEFWGLKGKISYDKLIEEKREYPIFKEQKYKLLEFEPYDVEGELEKVEYGIKRKLESSGIGCTKLPEDEIWKRLNHKLRPIEKFTKIMMGFISKCLQKQLDSKELQDLIIGYKTDLKALQIFYNLAESVYVRFFEELAEKEKTTFELVRKRAEEEIRAGKTIASRKSGNVDISKLRYVFIDEFQDFSKSIASVIQAMCVKYKAIDLFCVGDDWQAIYGFAGSDLWFFENFEKYFEKKSTKLNISTNYRSSEAIVNLGNVLMNRSGREELALANNKTKGEIFIADFDQFEQSNFSKRLHLEDRITPAIIRLILKAKQRDIDVGIVLLVRQENSVPDYKKNNEKKNKMERYLEHIYTFIPENERRKVGISTVHKYKGMEEEMVILLDVTAQNYPLLHQNRIFVRIFGENDQKIIEEERRLLYVALTRAKNKLVIITNRNDKSPFLVEIEKKVLLKTINWADYPEKENDALFLIEIGNQFSPKKEFYDKKVRDKLLEENYKKIDISDYCLAKIVSAKLFDIEKIKLEKWAINANGIEVRIYDYQNMIMYHYHVYNGKWESQISLN